MTDTKQHQHHDLQTVQAHVADLHTYHRNPRQGDIGAIAVSLNVNGQYRPIVVNRGTHTGRPDEVLAGNHTLMAARELGWPTIAAVYVDVDEHAATRIVLADNRTADLGTYDEGALADLIRSLDGEYAGSGYDGDDLDDILATLNENPFDHQDDDGETSADIDEVSEPPADPITQPGDVWVLGKHRIVCGDARDPETVARLLDGASINLAFTSPPYASQREYDEGSGFRPIPPDEYVEWFDAVQANVAAHLADDGSWFVNIKPGVVDGERHLYVLDLVLAHRRQWGWAFIDDYAWVRNTPPGSWPNRFKNGHEPVYHFGRTPRVKFRPRAVEVDGLALHKSSEVGANTKGTNGDYWNVSGQHEPGKALPFNVLEVSGVERGTGHTAAFPVGLPEWFVRAFTDEGDVVFDPFMGSGTTLIAADMHDRVAYGTELSPAYCDVIVQRWERITGGTAQRIEAS